MGQDYIILREDSKWDLQKQVREYLKRGYKPVGSVSVDIQRGGFFDTSYKETWTQAIIKEE